MGLWHTPKPHKLTLHGSAPKRGMAKWGGKINRRGWKPPAPRRPGKGR